MQKFSKMVKYVLLGTIIVLTFGFVHYHYLSAETLNVRVADTNKGVFVSLCEVGKSAKDGCDEYRNEDEIFWFKMDSGKVRARLGIAETDREEVAVKVYGYRINLFSMRKNILKVVE